MTIDPDVVQHVLQKNNKNYEKSKLQTESFGQYIGHGLLTANGEYWLRQRRLIQPGFYKAKISVLVDTMFSEVREFVDGLESKVKINSTPIDVSAEMTELTLKVVSRSLFTTGISNEQIKDLGIKFTAVQEHIIKEVRQPVLNWWRVLIGETKKAKRMSEEVKDILRGIIEHRKKQTFLVGDLLDMLIHSKYEDTDENMTDEQILDEALIIFTAGHETTANSLSWCFYLLAQSPEIVEKIRSEYDAIKGQGISMESLMKAEYCQMVVSESMRMYPPAWILDRVALEDDEIKNVKIAKGDLVGLYVYGSHHNPALWPNPDRFIPERFSKDAVKQQHTYAYYPFGGGPRLCIGNHFAMMEMQMSLFALLDKFDWTLSNDQPVQMQPMITLRPASTIWMNLSVRA
jgi:cytochrome P450